MEPNELVDGDPRRLKPGWWKTGAGWKSAVRTGGTDPRAKPVVFALVAVMFLLAAWALNWERNRSLAGLGALVLLVAAVEQPPGVNGQPPVPQGWWKSIRGWRTMLAARPDDPVRRFFPLLFAVAAALIVFAMVGVDAWFFALLFIPLGLVYSLKPDRFTKRVDYFVLVGVFLIMMVYFALT